MTVWKYCECGCHGYECGKYWAFHDLRGDNLFHLHRGHGWISPKLGFFQTVEDCTRQIRIMEGHDEIDFELATIEYDYAIHPEAMKRIRLIVDQLKERSIAS